MKYGLIEELTARFDTAKNKEEKQAALKDLLRTMRWIEKVTTTDLQLSFLKNQAV